MAAHQVDIYEAELEGDYSTVTGLEGQCRVSGERVEVFGTSDRSERALLAQVSERCRGWHVRGN